MTGLSLFFSDLSQSRRLPLLQVVSNNKSFSVGVQFPTEINAPRGCAVILRRICQLTLTRITHQVSRAFDLNCIFPYFSNSILSCNTFRCYVAHFLNTFYKSFFIERYFCNISKHFVQLITFICTFYCAFCVFLLTWSYHLCIISSWNLYFLYEFHICLTFLKFRRV